MGPSTPLHTRSWHRSSMSSAIAMASLVTLVVGCAPVRSPGPGSSSEPNASGISNPFFRRPPLTASAALGQGDSTRDASLRLVIAGLDEDTAGRPSRALANYQRAVRVDATNPFAYLALARHHLEGDSVAEADAFLDQARSLFEAEDRLGPPVDVWGVGLRAMIDRAEGQDALADQRFARARRLSPEIWLDERLSAAELR